VSFTRQPLLSGFDGGLVGAVELKSFAVSLAGLLFHGTLPEISNEAEDGCGFGGQALSSSSNSQDLW